MDDFDLVTRAVKAMRGHNADAAFRFVYEQRRRNEAMREYNKNIQVESGPKKKGNYEDCKRV